MRKCIQTVVNAQRAHLRAVCRYIISYPISGGKDFNMVLNHEPDHPVTSVEEVDISEVREYYKDWDPRIRRIVDMVPSVQRWPLLVTGPLESWSSPQKNVVLMGDAAHSMVNHMAQGAATSMEDGAFLGRCLREVVRGRLAVAEAIGIYERARMPLAHKKQQISFLNGALWHLPDGAAQEARDGAMAAELKGEQLIRSPNLYADPVTVWETYAYDAAQHAEDELAKWFNEGKEPMDEETKVTRGEAYKFMDWCLAQSKL